MNKFENWWKNRGGLDCSAKGHSEDGWKAALVWVLADIKTCQDEDCYGNLREDILTDDIKKELEEK